MFISSKHQRSSKLALATFILAFVVILLGAYTRLTDAGLSCPDWPNCYGYFTAPHTPSQLQVAAQHYSASPINVKKAWIEMTHRYFAGTEGILILMLVVSLLFHRKTKEMKSPLIASALILLLGIQIMLGMLTVTEKLRPVIVLAHLITGLSLLGTLWWAYLNSYLRTDSFNRKLGPDIIPWFWGAFIIVAIQIALGGWVSTHYAGLACIDFPYCNGTILPTMHWGHLNSHLITIHMLHRIGAFITAVYLGILGFKLLTYPTFKFIGFSILALITMQITLGILNIIWLRPVWLALTHHMVAILLLLTTLTLLIKIPFTTERRYGSWTA